MYVCKLFEEKLPKYNVLRVNLYNVFRRIMGILKQNDLRYFCSSQSSCKYGHQHHELKGYSQSNV